MNQFLNWQKNSQFLLRFSILVVIGSCVFTLTASLGKYSWFLDLTSHFPLQYLAVQLLAIIVVLKAKPRAYPVLCLVFLILIFINASRLYDYYGPNTPGSLPKQTSSHLKILHMNVFVFNGSHRAVADILKTSDADIISLQEINDAWLQGLNKAGGLTAFPYRLVHLESGNILASRLPLINPRIVPIHEGRLGALIGKSAGGILLADLKLADKTVSLINLHPPIPLTPKYQASYLRYFEQLDAHKKDFRKDIILIGDLNTTPWSKYYYQYLHDLNLKDMRAHQGFYPTWNAFLPIFAIPIDHVLASENFIPLKQKVGPFIGSDHLPVYIELVLLNRD